MDCLQHSFYGGTQEVHMNQNHGHQGLKQDENEIKNLQHKKPLGIYIHIPFCVKKCGYCDFLSAPATEQTKADYVKALQKEIVSYQEEASDYIVKTIFFGGGTPSCIDPLFIEDILTTIGRVFLIEETAEISIEVNPGTMEPNMFQTYIRAGINRLSLGLQSSNDDELKRLDRIHSYEEFLHNYKEARKAGFQNINIDLMSALPGQTLESWENTLENIVNLNPEHISAYSLIIEDNTPFYQLYGGKNRSLLPDEETDRLMYQRTKEMLAKHGYHRYEISNYCKEGYECKHNTIYWTGIDYIGFGIGAASLCAGIRYHNEEDLTSYINLCQDENLLLSHGLRRDIEERTKKDEICEFMYLGLRLVRGISIKEFEERFELSYDEIYGSITKELLQKKLLTLENDQLSLTELGLDLSNQVFVEFLLD